jgi:diguanylate cyclase (GGDEF)-like protein
VRRILGVIILCFVMATAYIAYVIAERQTALQKFSRYNDSWSIGQTVSEYMRLEHVLANYALDMNDETLEEARLRLDIMLGRLGLFQQGNLRSFIQNDPQRRDLFLKLNDILESLDTSLNHLDVESIRSQLEAMTMLDGPMTALASSAVEYDVGLIDRAQAEVRQLHLIYTALAAGLILCGVVLIVLLIRHNQLLDRAHGSMQRLTSDLRHATGELQSQNFRLEHDAHHDALTGLPNRVLFRQDLEERLRKAQIGGPFATILLLDLDGFKDVNDTLGHDIGDALLQAVASRLIQVSSNKDVVCRLGGDEFALLTTTLADTDALKLAEQLMEAISRPYHVGELELKIDTCVGVAISQGGPNTEELFKHADLALYEAKALGPGHASLFKSQMQTRLREKKSFEADLQKALLNGEMAVFYQPQALTNTREICGYEALVRWTHPTRGSVSPIEFISVAERIGFIHVLGEWVLKSACNEAAQWTKPLKIAVNLSPVQFRSINLIQNVVDALNESGLDAQRLELEITESVLLDKNEHTLNTLRQLKALGIQIAMDDFGTGYSSLGSLSGFPFDKIKIDRSFVRDVTTRLDALAIVELVTGVGRSLKMLTIAEGIETEEQFECLKRLGCDQVQGYLIGKPMAADELSYIHRSSTYRMKAVI